MAVIANLDINVRARIKSLRRGLKKAGGVVKRFGRRVARVARGMALFGAAVITAGAIALAALVRSQFKAIDAIGKLSVALDISTEKLAAYQFAASIAGLETAQFNKGVKRLRKSVADANNGLTTAIRGFKVLGLESKELAGLDTDEVLKRVADSVQRLGGTTEVAGALADLFGAKVGPEMFNLLMQGRAGLEAFEEEAKILGISLNAVDTAKVELANDAMNRVKQTFIGLGRQIAIRIAPLLIELSEAFLRIIKNAGGMQVIVGKAFSFIATAVGVVADVVDVFLLGFIALKLAVTFGIGVIIKVWGKLAQAIQFVVNLLPGVTASFGDSLNNIADAVLDTAGTIKDELHDAFIADPPSKRIDRFLKDIERKTTEAAKKIAEEREKFNLQAPPSPAVTTIKIQRPAAILKDTQAAFTAILQARQQGAKTAEQKAQEVREKQLAALQGIDRNLRDAGQNELGIAIV